MTSFNFLLPGKKLSPNFTLGNNGETVITRIMLEARDKWTDRDNPEINGQTEITQIMLEARNKWTDRDNSDYVRSQR